MPKSTQFGSLNRKQVLAIWRKLPRDEQERIWQNSGRTGWTFEMFAGSTSEIHKAMLNERHPTGNGS